MPYAGLSIIDRYNYNMKTFVTILFALMASLNLFSQLEFFQIERFNKQLDLVITDPFIAPHWPVGLIYKDTSNNAFTNLSDRLLRIADGPIGFQYINQNILFTETGKNYYSINRYDNPHDKLVWLGPDKTGYWGARDPGSFGSRVDFNTWGNIYTINSQGHRLSELSQNSGTGALKLYRYSGGFIFANMLTINAAGIPVWLAVSDRRAKKNIVDSEPILDRLRQLKLKNYTYKGNDKMTSGFIAQEVQEVFPDLVEKMEDGMLGVNYMGFSPLAIQAINEQQEIIDSLEDRIIRLEKLITEK